MIVDAWFDYWIEMKEKTVRPNTSRNYRERYERNIRCVIGSKLIADVKPIHCQQIFNKLADEGYRTIPLTDEAIRILKNQRAKNAELKVIPIEWSDTVFLCRNGTPVKNNTYDTGLMKYCDRANIPRFSMHVLRHTFAARCIEAGMKPKTLQQILGHSNIGITMNLYVHITEDEKLREINLVADALKVI